MSDSGTRAPRAGATILDHPALTRTRRRLARVRWWTWSAAALAVAAIATGLVFLLLMQDATPLAPDALTAWVYRQDAARQVMTSAGSAQQVTVPIRYGQEQGFTVSILNDSDWTQTVLGLQDPYEVFGTSRAQVAIGNGPEVNPGLRGDVYDELPRSIPPHSVRLLRVTWLSDLCDGRGGIDILPELKLRVRVGFVTRTEDVPFVISFGLEGTKESAAHCR